MQISWLTKFSLLDFPWKISCIVFTAGCNLRCPFCHNPELVFVEDTKNIISEKDFFNFLESRKWFLDWVSICWWEPTVQKDLLKFCEKIKKKWFLVKIDTNWSYPDVIKRLLDKRLVDYIAMDIKNPIEKLNDIVWVKIKIDNFIKSKDLLLKSKIDYEFRTTLIAWIHTTKDIKKMAKFISWAKNYFLQNYKPWNTLKKDFKWKSFSRLELEEFKEICKKYVKNIEIRNFL